MPKQPYALIYAPAIKKHLLGIDKVHLLWFVKRSLSN